MAILYGTQSNGETLPVQVNSFGQLVAQGLDGAKGEKGDKGDKGDQGEQGEQGDPGSVSGVEISRWDPVIEFRNDGAALFEVDSAEGKIFNVGGFQVVAYQIIIDDIGITNPRGYPVVTGFPTLLAGGYTKVERQIGFLSQTSLFKPLIGMYHRLSLSGDDFEFYSNSAAGTNQVVTTDIEDQYEGKQVIHGTFFGTLATAAEIAEQREEALREAANS